MTLNGIQNLALFKQRIEIRTVVTVLNYRRLPKLAEFIYRNLPFVIHIAFMGMETRELAKKNLDQVWIDPYEYQSYLNEAIEFLSLRQMNTSIYNHQLCVLPKTLWPYSRKSISTWKNIYLPECEQCQKRDFCGGFFESSMEIHSKYIQPLTI
jgi:His-Xaa-Ser system radical SAM maturase HxsC